jgi:hypothetical protein
MLVLWVMDSLKWILLDWQLVLGREGSLREVGERLGCVFFKIALLVDLQTG